MRSSKKKGFASVAVSGSAAVQTSVPSKAVGGRKAKASSSPWKLTFGKDRNQHLARNDITFIFRNLATLIENGVSLPKAIGTLADEKALEAARPILLGVRRKLESGAAFSATLATYPAAFDNITINQIKVGERAGSLAETLGQIATQREKAGRLRGEIIKKLAYPLVLVVVGSLVIAFLLTYVVPVFEETYSSSGVPLPGITQALIMVGTITKSYGLYLIFAVAAGVLLVKQMRKSESFAFRMDTQLLKLPMIGYWLRDIAILELMDVLGNLMEAGFTLAEALAEAADSVSNRAIKRSVNRLRSAVQRGERFSKEVENQGDLFPPLVSQLVIVGEQTGNLTKATRHIRSHLEEQIERGSNILVGVIEPVLTISLASAVAVILLAIYLPMFDMINTVG